MAFAYLPDRRVELEYIGENNFRVIVSENGSLREGDIVNVTCFILNHPLRVSSVIREGENLGAYTAGKISGLTSLTLEKL